MSFLTPVVSLGVGLLVCSWAFSGAEMRSPLAIPCTPVSGFLLWSWVALSVPLERSLGSFRFSGLVGLSLLVTGLGMALTRQASGAFPLGGLEVPVWSSLTAFARLYWAAPTRLGLGKWDWPLPTPVVFWMGLAGLFWLSPWSHWPVLLIQPLLTWWFLRSQGRNIAGRFGQGQGAGLSRLASTPLTPSVSCLREARALRQLSSEEMRMNSILEKLRHEGMQSLSPEESQVLDSSRFSRSCNEDRF